MSVFLNVFVTKWCKKIHICGPNTLLQHEIQ